MPATIEAGAAVHANESPESERKKTRADRKTEALYDSALVERFNRAGDQSAFAEIFHRYYDRIVMVARQVLHDPFDAQDIAQETFVRAYRGLANFRGDAALASWLYCIALNLSRNRYWHFFCRRRHQTFSIDQFLLADGTQCHFADVLPDHGPDPRLETMNNEFVALVSQCVDQLDDLHREILVLRTVLHHSYEEISVALSINVSTVKSRIARAREKLRSLILASAPDFGHEAEMAEYFEPVHAFAHSTRSSQA